MNFTMIPRAKRANKAKGYFAFESLQFFSVGGGEAFGRTLKALLPEVKIEAAERENANVILSVASVFSSQPEYCAIRIWPDRLELRCRDEAGARNAACILAQIIEDNRIPCGDIADWPDAPYRAMMLESSGRCWLSMERIYLYIRQMALARMNELQFHFMEFPGCTIQLDCYPDMHGFGPDNLKYSKEEIRAMIAYAAELGITVTPFVEVLSHSFAFNKAADIACPGDTDERMFAVCVGQEKTYEAIEKVLAEVADLFPSPLLHIGGDEYDMSAVSPRTVHWGECPHCRALSKRMGYTTYRELFIYAVERVNQIVNKLGKVAMLWNADLKPGELPDSLERNLVIHYYRNDNILCKEKIFGLSMDGYVEEGFSVLNSSFRQTYLDKYVTSERLSSWGYTDDPRVSAPNRAGVIGGCCCAWDASRHFERSISPSIFLFADRLWHSYGDPTNYDDAFGRQLTRLMFDGLLPADMNVFDAVGDVLPPLVLEKDVLFHERKMVASLAELERIHTALTGLNHPLAAPYAEIAAAALAFRKAQTDTPLKKTLQFEG
ncbi:MAG: family 20 glycosylhydrolase [Clostridia bacterium]|nr:family 20 glycosylhydrolase [Clostridia bacterium]